MILIPKENVIRLEENKCIRKLEDLLDAEIKTLEKFINKASEVKRRLYKLDLDEDVKKNVLSAYDEIVSKYVYENVIKNIVYYTLLICYAKVLKEKRKLFCYEDSKGAIYVHYLPHIKELQK